MNETKPTCLTWLARCPACGRGLLFGLRPFSHTWFQLMWEQCSATYACRKCGTLFDVNIRKTRWLGALWGVMCIPAILLLSFIFAKLHAPDSLAFVIFLLPIVLCLWAQAGIRCLTPLKQGEGADKRVAGSD